MSERDTDIKQPVHLSVETFGIDHPRLDPEVFLNPARAALGRFHVSPAPFLLLRDGLSEPATVAFEAPDPRTSASLERERVVELGAILLAGTVLALEGKHITRVVPRRGWRFDYFAGDDSDAERFILEVGGTDDRSFTSLLREKERQVQESPYRGAPHYKVGIAAATRFAPAAQTGLSRVDEMPLAREGWPGDDVGN